MSTKPIKATPFVPDPPIRLGGILGSNTPIPLVRMKGWLFWQSWLTRRPGEQLHPLRWTSISKGQVWCAPPKGSAEYGTD